MSPSLSSGFSNQDLDINNRQTVEAGLQFFRTILDQFHADLCDVRTELQGIVCSWKAEARAKEDLICLRDFTEWVLNFCKEQYTHSAGAQLNTVISDAEVLFRSLCDNAKYPDLTYRIRSGPLLSQTSSWECSSGSTMVYLDQAVSMTGIQTWKQWVSVPGTLALSNCLLSSEGTLACKWMESSLMSVAPYNLNTSMQGITNYARRQLETSSRSLSLPLSSGVVSNSPHQVSTEVSSAQPRSPVLSSSTFLPTTVPMSILRPVTNTLGRETSNFRPSLAVSSETITTCPHQTSRCQQGVSSHPGRRCSNCFEETTRQWVRKFKEESEWLCHACGQYWRKNRRDRPSELWQRPMLRRNSRKICRQRTRRGNSMRNSIGSVLPRSGIHSNLRTTSENVRTTTETTHTRSFLEEDLTSLTMHEPAVCTDHFLSPELPNLSTQSLEMLRERKADECFAQDTLSESDRLPSFETLLSSIRKDCSAPDPCVDTSS